MTLATDLASRAQTLGQQVVAAVSPQYQNGTFWQGSLSYATCFPVAAGMATLARYTTNSALKAAYVAIIQEIVENQINTNMVSTKDAFVDIAADPTGWYGQFPDAEAMRVAPRNELMTMSVIEALGWILWQIPDGAIDAATRARWVKVCQDCCNKLDTWPGGSITTYYINANFQCALMSCYWFAALASTSDADKLKYQDMYERAYRFMIQPAVETAPSTTWVDWGLTIDVEGSEPDWSDFEVHLTETNTRDMSLPDFDWQYSQAQMSHLSQIYVANRDPRVMRLINGISNKIYPRILQVDGEFPAWTLDARSGSRQNGPRVMDSPWPFVQGLLSGKRQRRELLTSAQQLSIWDTGHGTVYSLTGEGVNASSGAYPLVADLQTVGVVLQAAQQVIASTARIPA